MKNIIFEKLKLELISENEEKFKEIFDAIWDVYEANPNQFVKICNETIKIFNSKAFTLKLNADLIHFTDWNIPDDNIKKILEVTSWENIQKFDNHTIEIIDFNKITPIELQNEIENGVYIFRNYILFEKLFFSLSRELDLFR